MAAGSLHKAHSIRYERDKISIVDRLGLENANCECRGIGRRASDRLFASAEKPGPIGGRPATIPRIAAPDVVL
jgi:hypothetical protein